MTVLLMVLGWLRPAGAILSGALRNPYVLGALAGLAVLLLWRIEESRITSAKAHTAKVEAAWRAAFAQEQLSFRTVDGALRQQNAAVTAWAVVGRQKTERAASSWSTDRKALEAAQTAASSRPAPDPHGDATAQAQAIFAASKQALR